MCVIECHFRPPCRKVDGAHEQVHEIAEIERLNADKGIAADIRKRDKPSVAPM